MKKREKRNKIIKLSFYVSMLIFSFIACIIYKNNIYSSGTDDIARISQNGNNVVNSNGQVIDEGIEIVDEKAMSDFYTIEKDYELKKSIKEDYYIVKKGDTLLKIAQKTGQDMNVLVENNPQLANGNIKVGDKIKILSENGIYYTVKKGDSIGKIAKIYNVKDEDIKNANDISNNNIKAGEKLFIPNPDFAYVERQRKIREAKEKREKEMRLAKLTKKKQLEEEKKIAKIIKQKEIGKGSGDIFGNPISWHGVTSYFGTRYHPVYRKYIFHKGVDLKARVGESVYAAAEGEVIFTGWLGGYGKLIIIKHDNGYSTRYGHLDSIDVNVGDKVSKGTFIGTAGETGIVTGPHLHFEVRKDDTPLNPLRFLR